MPSIIELARFANITRQSVYEMKKNNPARFRALQEAFIGYKKSGSEWDRIKFLLSKNELYYVVDKAMKKNNIAEVVREFLEGKNG